MKKFILIVSMLAGALASLGAAGEATPTNFVLRGAWPESSNGVAVAVAVAGRYAYVANGLAGLAVIDVTDPAHPVQVGRYETAGYADAIVVRDRFVYLNASFGTHVLDVTDPTRPLSLGSLDRTAFFRTGQAVGDRLFLAAASFKVLNVGDAASPTLVADIEINGNALDLHIADDYVYFAGDLWWSIYRITDPLHPVWVSTSTMAPFVNQIAAANHHAYVAEEMTLHTFDVRDPAHPVRVGSQALNGWVGDLEAVQNDLYVAHSDGGVSVFDTSDPARPVRVTGYDTGGFAQDVEVVGNYLFVADGSGGLVILERQPLELPALTVAHDSTNVVVRWPASALGFALEANSGLNPSNWVPVLTTPRLTNATFSISSSALGHGFFRLRRP